MSDLRTSPLATIHRVGMAAIIRIYRSNSSRNHARDRGSALRSGHESPPVRVQSLDDRRFSPSEVGHQVTV
jgi:hypothetical protein